MNDTNLLLLTARTIFALCLIFIVLWGLSAYMRKRGVPGRQGSLPREPVQVIGNCRFNRNTMVTVVRVRDRGLVLGVTEQSVHLLAEIDCSSSNSALDTGLDASLDTSGLPNEEAKQQNTITQKRSTTGTALLPPRTGTSWRAGSTWKTALNGLREKTVRRG